MRPFEPLFRNRHIATVAANFWPRNYADVFEPQARLFQTEEDVRVLGIVQEPRQEPQGDVIMVHGLEGSHNSGYMVSMAQALLRAGFRTTRLNVRTCGGTESYCRTLYHAGLTSDLAHVVRTYRVESARPIFLIGYSLGGNVVLKFAGEAGEFLQGVAAGVVAVSTPIDLAACCRQMMRLENQIYERRFLKRLKERYGKRAAAFPDLFPMEGLEGVRSVFEFDDLFTAKHFQFGTGENYYGTQSAQRFLGGIAVPTLLIQAKDDPLIPFEVYSHPSLAGNANIRLIVTEHGGHVGFISRKPPRFWADEVVRDWIVERNGTKRTSTAS